VEVVLKKKKGLVSRYLRNFGRSNINVYNLNILIDVRSVLECFESESGANAGFAEEGRERFLPVRGACSSGKMTLTPFITLRTRCN